MRTFDKMNLTIARNVHKRLLLEVVNVTDIDSVKLDKKLKRIERLSKFINKRVMFSDEAIDLVEELQSGKQENDILKSHKISRRFLNNFKNNLNSNNGTINKRTVQSTLF